jgi:hypothetical protein
MADVANRKHSPRSETSRENVRVEYPEEEVVRHGYRSW